MKVQKTKDSLALTYKSLSVEGALQSKSVVINDLNNELVDADAYEIALLVKGIMFLGAEKILRRSEVQFLED